MQKLLLPLLRASVTERQSYNDHQHGEGRQQQQGFLRRRGSSPATLPMMGELTTRPSHPAVSATPVAVATRAPLKVALTMASVVGNTGAMAMPARNTRNQAAVVDCCFGASGK